MLKKKWRSCERWALFLLTLDESKAVGTRRSCERDRRRSGNEREGMSPGVRWSPMAQYDVVVRNERTGEVVTVSVESPSGPDAQVSALCRLFRTLGWRKALAMQPALAGACKAEEA